MKLTCGIIYFTEGQRRSLEMSQESKKLRSKGEKTICLPIVDESFYLEIIENTVKFRAYLDEIIPEYREIFPEEIEKIFNRFQGFLPCWPVQFFSKTSSSF